MAVSKDRVFVSLWCSSILITNFIWPFEGTCNTLRIVRQRGSRRSFFSVDLFPKCLLLPSFALAFGLSSHERKWEERQAGPCFSLICHLFSFKVISLCSSQPAHKDKSAFAPPLVSIKVCIVFYYSAHLPTHILHSDELNIFTLACFSSFPG